MVINSFLKIWSKKINDFFEIHPKIMHSNIFNKNNMPFEYSFSQIKGIKNISIDDFNTFDSYNYIADMCTTKLVKEKIDGLNSQYTDGKVLINSNDNKLVLYDGLNFLKNKDKLYTTYSEIVTTTTVENVSTKLATEELGLIYNDISDDSIVFSFDATYKQDESHMAKDRNLFLKSNYVVSPYNDINFSVNIDTSSLQNSYLPEIPYDFYQGSVVVYNNEIHILGGHGNTYGHYKWDREKWEYVSDLPFSFHQGSAVVCDGKIHILGGAGGLGQTHAVWDGEKWETLDLKLPYTFYSGSVIVYHNKIFILGGGANNNQKNFYVLNDENIWEQLTDIPYNFRQGSAVVYDDKIYIFGSNASSDTQTNYCVWDSNSWGTVKSLDFIHYNGGAIVHDNAIHLLGNTTHYKFNGDNFEYISELPYYFNQGCSVDCTGTIYILGSITNSRSFYLFIDGEINAEKQWTQEQGLIYVFLGYRTANDKNGKLLTAKDIITNKDYTKLKVLSTDSYSFNLANDYGITDNIYLCFYVYCPQLTLSNYVEQDAVNYITVKLTIE